MCWLDLFDQCQDWSKLKKLRVTAGTVPLGPSGNALEHSHATAGVGSGWIILQGRPDHIDICRAAKVYRGALV
jgi:hypothetical protein